MVARLGISIFDLLPQTTDVANFVPDALVERLGVLTILEHRSTVSADFILHAGTLQSAGDILDLAVNDSALSIPGLTQGLPFRLAIRRGAVQAGGQEGPPTDWTLDLLVNDVELLLPGQKGARRAGGAGVAPLHLEKLDPPRKVFLVASGTIRIDGGQGRAATLQLVDSPDPFDPTVPTGAVARLTVRPPHFFLFGSEYGLTLDRFQLDLSAGYTPADVVARGHGEDWQGVSFKEATFYTPADFPLLPSLSISARDVILGDPGGRQGELRVEFGADYADQFAAHIQVLRKAAQGDDQPVAQTTPAGSTVLEYGIDVSAAGLTDQARARFGFGDLVPGHTDIGVVGVWWQLPDGREGNDQVTPYFAVPTAGALRYQLRLGDPTASYAQAPNPSTVPDGQTPLTPATVRFPRIGAAKPPAPFVDMTVGSESYSNVVHVRARADALALVEFHARREGAEIEADWVFGTGSAPASARKAKTFKLPPLEPKVAVVDLLVTAGSEAPRRVRIEVIRRGNMTVGHQADATPAATGRVSEVANNALEVESVASTFEAAGFHRTGDRKEAAQPATVAATVVTVPAGVIAEVELPLSADSTLPTPAPEPVAAEPPRRELQLLFPFGEPDAGNVVVIEDVVFPADATKIAADTEAASHVDPALPIAAAPRGRDKPAGSSAEERIASWLAALGAGNQRKFLVVGRTDDLRFNKTLADNKAKNDELAMSRAQAAKRELVKAGVAAGDVILWIETAGRPALPTALETVAVPARFAAANPALPPRLALPADRVKTPAGKTRPAWNARWTDDGPDSKQHFLARDDLRRVGYRSADILALDAETAPTPTPTPTPTPEPGAVPTRMLVPGPDGPPPPTLPSTEAKPPSTDYRVRARVKWDSPTVVNSADLIPTEAELLIAWKAAETELPESSTATANGTNPPVIPKPTGLDFWELVLRLAYDARTEQTQLDGSLSLPDGTLLIRSDALAGALAFGPAFMALVDPADVREGFTDDSGKKLAAAAAILAAGAVVGELINTGDGPESSVDIDKFAISYRWNGPSRVSATLDYTVDLHVDVALPGDSRIKGAIKLRYKGVGLRFDSGKTGLDSVAVTYDGLSVEVADPGQWSLGGPLGNLIRIAASRIGNGSTWMELDLEFALDLGVVRLEGATIRIVLQPFSVELRGLTAVIDIPGVIEGKGSVTVGGAGAIRALLALQVIPARLGAYGALAIERDFVAVEVGVQFPVGIPLANTGLGLFGLMGRFVANGARNVSTGTNQDPVQRELDWYALDAKDKYARRSGQYAIGLGAVIGTLPDSAFTFNAEGSLAIGFPDVSVLLGIDAHLLSERKQAATEKGETNDNTLNIRGMTLIDEQSVMVAVRAAYEIPKILKLNIPFSAYYPLADSGQAWFIRLGSDNHPTRPGSPITATIFPGLLDITAWAFLMVEEKQLHGLGGTVAPKDLLPTLDFDGYAVGMGAGFEIRKKAGPFKLEIAAALLVGFGTKPLLFAGAAGVRGELDLKIVSVGVDGVVDFHISDAVRYIHGHFCGHVSFLFFSVSGCVDIHIGDPVPSDIPTPASPLLGVDLCDHLSAVKGRASVDPANPPVVWPDMVAVLKFGHYVEDALGSGDDVDFKRLVPPAAASGPWSGSTELKYAFQLTRLELHRLTGGDPTDDASWTRVTGKFDSAWWLPSHRAASVSSGNQPSSEEGRELGLFHWDPRAWSRWLGEGSQTLPGDPAGGLGEVCNVPTPAERSCVRGEAARAALFKLAAFDAVPGLGAVFPSRYTVQAEAVAPFTPTALATLAGDAGWTYRPGGIATLHGSVNYEGQYIERCWRLPALWQADLFVLSAPVRFGFSKPLVEGEMLLEICLTQKALGIRPPRGWDAMPAEPAEAPRFQGASGTIYASERPMAVTRVGDRIGRVLTAPLTADFRGESALVRVELVARGDTRIAGYDHAGVMVAEAYVQRDDELATVSLDGPGISRLVIEPKRGATLVRVRWSGDEPALAGELSDVPDPDLMVVLGVLAGGKKVPLTPRIVPPTDISSRSCFKFAYPLPLEAQGWVAIEVPPHRRGEVALVSMCGVTLEAKAAEQQEGEWRGGLSGLLHGLADGFITDPEQPTREIYLDPATTYQLRATWKWDGWRPASPGDEPGTPANWRDGGTDRYTFRTAAFGQAPVPAAEEHANLADDPAQGGPGYDERVFDPRGLARFVMATTPTHTAAPHFLDDRVGFWFSVDHIHSLVGRYDRVPLVKVYRTDPEPAALNDAPPTPGGGKHPLDVTLATHFRLETLSWFAADHRFGEAAAAQGCIGGTPPLGSSSVSVDADLKPRADYDLLMTVGPKTVGASPEVLVARSHFRTSRYRNPAGLLGGLGFHDPEGFAQPFDAIATGDATAGPAEVSDATLDALMAQLGLDPWPLPAGPRTSVIWRRPAAGEAWQVIGALVEADEAVVRPGFVTGAVDDHPTPRVAISSLTLRRTTERTILFPTPPGRAPRPPRVIRSTTAIATLAERVRNAAGTRLLFLTPAPVSLAGGIAYDLRLVLEENGVAGAAGTMPLYDRPLTVFQEGA